MYRIIGGVYLGWALGSNDAANVFGTAVASRMVAFRTAAVLASVFVLVGAVCQGAAGIHTLSGIAEQDLRSALRVSVAAAVTVTAMTWLRLPVSTSQAVVGAILGSALAGASGAAGVRWGALVKVAACWVGTPVGGAVAAFVLYPVLARLLDRLRLGLLQRSVAIKVALILSGAYGAYALGANNVANVVGVYHGQLPGPVGRSPTALALIGGSAIALGILTFSRKVMFTVGRDLVQLDAFSALVAVLAAAATVHLYAHVGVPVSTSTAIVGAVLGIGLFKGVKTINPRVLAHIAAGWLATPLAAGAACYVPALLLR